MGRGFSGGASPVSSAEAVGTVLDLDLTTLTPVASYAAGTHTIGGMTWTLAKDAAVTAKLNTPANDGLAISSDPADVNWSAMVTLNLGQVGLSAYALRKQIAVWARIESSLPNVAGCWNGPGFSGFAANISLPLANAGWLGMLAKRNGGASNAFAPLLYEAGTEYPALGTQLFTGNSTDDVLVVTCSSLESVSCFSGVWSSGWPAWSALRNRSQARVNSSSWPAISGNPPTPAEMNFAIWVSRQPGASATQMSMKLKALKIEVG